MDTKEQIPTEEVIEEEVIEPAEPIEEPEPEVPNVEEQPAEEPVKEPDPEPEPEVQPSRRESLRIQQLIQKMKTPDAPAPKEPEAAPGGIDYKATLDAPEDILSQLESDRATTNTAAREQGRSEAMEEVKYIRFSTRLDIDAPRIESKYPVLDKESAQFNPAVANALNSMYLSAVGYTPGDEQSPAKVSNSELRYADYIEGLMELADEVASEKNAATVKNVAEQASSTGLRPDGSKPKTLNLDQAPENMTEEELKAVIAQSFKK